MRCLLTRGLRSLCPNHGGDWHELLTHAIQGKWLPPASSPQTLDAERGLSIVGEPYYFYVLRAEDSYGLVVFVLSEAEGASWPEGARGATPFDSGGWWLGKIHTEPSLSRDTRRSAFIELEVPLHDWQAAFQQYIRTQYDELSDYIEGCAPQGHEHESRFTIIREQPNTTRAWTWEVRVPHALIQGRLVLQKAYMTEVSRDEYMDWLWRSSLADHESLRIDRWIRDHVIVPEDSTLVAEAVRRAISQEAARG